MLLQIKHLLRSIEFYLALWLMFPVSSCASCVKKRVKKLVDRTGHEALGYPSVQLFSVILKSRIRRALHEKVVDVSPGALHLKSLGKSNTRLLVVRH